MRHSFHRWLMGLAAGAVMAGASAQAVPNADPGEDRRGHWHHGWHRHHHHHCHRHGERGWDGPMSGGPWGGHAPMFTHGLQLTDAQRQRFQTILSNARQNASKARHDRGHAGLALMNPGDPEFPAAVQAAKQRAAERIQRISDLRQQLYNVLTPEQKNQVQTRIAARQARLAEHGDDVKGPPAPASR